MAAGISNMVLKFYISEVLTGRKDSAKAPSVWFTQMRY